MRGQCYSELTKRRRGARLSLKPADSPASWGQAVDIFSIDINQIADLTTQVGTSGAIRSLELVGDDVFDYIIGVAILIYEVHPFL